jgi:hypothetical protein
VQVTGVVPVQAPAWQAAAAKQMAVHEVPSFSVGFEHVPVVGSQVPAAWHWSLAVHVIGVPVQAPDWQVSPVTHRFPSLHDVPLGSCELEHVPVLGLHSLA